MKEASGFVHKKLYCTVGDVSVCGILDAGTFLGDVLTYEPHVHLQHEVHIVCKGKYTLENLEGTEKVILEEGMIVLIPPQYYHNTMSVENIETDKFSFRMEFGYIKSNKEDEFYESLNRSLKMHEKEITVLDGYEDALKSIQKIREYMWCEDFGSRAIATAYFKVLVTELIIGLTRLDADRSVGNVKKVNEDSAVKRKDMINYILTSNYPDPEFDLKTYAKMLNMSEKQANRITVKFYGVSFHQLLSDTRLNCGMKLLVRTNMSIKKISEMVGYESTTGFHLAFKRKFGVSPGEYRKNREKQ